MTDPSQPQGLTEVKQYRFVRQLGKGGMGTVFEAIDTRDGGRVAVKLLHPWLVAEDTMFRDRFEREAHIAALLRSPYSVRLLDFGVANDTYFLVMEYVEGATVGKVWGSDRTRDAGLGGATVRHDDLVVSALVAVNAYGDVDDAGGAGDELAEGVDPAAVAASIRRELGGVIPGENTTIGVVLTNARLDKVGCLVVAQGAHDGLARSLVPTHTRVDGDAFVAAATGAVDVPVDVVRHLALVAVERAVRGAVR